MSSSSLIILRRINLPVKILRWPSLWWREQREERQTVVVPSRWCTCRVLLRLICVQWFRKYPRSLEYLPTTDDDARSTGVWTSVLSGETLASSLRSIRRTVERRIECDWEFLPALRCDEPILVADPFLSVWRRNRPNVVECPREFRWRSSDVYSRTTNDNKLPVAAEVVRPIESVRHPQARRTIDDPVEPVTNSVSLESVA